MAKVRWVGGGGSEQFIDWLGDLLWHWQRGTPISPDALAETIMDVLDEHPKRASQLSAHPHPNVEAILREMEKPSSHTENPSSRECPDGFQVE